MQTTDYDSHCGYVATDSNKMLSVTHDLKHALGFKTREASDRCIKLLQSYVKAGFSPRLVMAMYSVKR
jgi:hypothetical protein